MNARTHGISALMESGSLMMKPPGTSGEKSAAEAPEKINVVLNWFEELKQQVPVP